MNVIDLELELPANHRTLNLLQGRLIEQFPPTPEIGQSAPPLPRHPTARGMLVQRRWPNEPHEAQEEGGVRGRQGDAPVTRQGHDRALQRAADLDEPVLGAGKDSLENSRVYVIWKMLERAVGGWSDVRQIVRSGLFYKAQRITHNWF